MATEIVDVDIKSFTVVELREELEKRGHEKTEKLRKADLIKRLENAIQKETKERDSSSKASISTDEHPETKAENHDDNDDTNEKTEASTTVEIKETRAATAESDPEPKAIYIDVYKAAAGAYTAKDCDDKVIEKIDLSMEEEVSFPVEYNTTSSTVEIKETRASESDPEPKAIDIIDVCKAAAGAEETADDCDDKVIVKIDLSMEDEVSLPAEYSTTSTTVEIKETRASESDPEPKAIDIDVYKAAEGAEETADDCDDKVIEKIDLSMEEEVSLPAEYSTTVEIKEPHAVQSEPKAINIIKVAEDRDHTDTINKKTDGGTNGSNNKNVIETDTVQNTNNVLNSTMKRKLLVNNLPPTLSQSDIMEMFSHIGPVSFCHLSRNNIYNITGENLGYAFVEYPNEELAANAITQIHNIKLDGRKVKVCYAVPLEPDESDTNLYITGLPLNVTDKGLFTLFSRFGSILSYKVLKNKDGQPRGIGFVRFAFHSEAFNAISELIGKVLSESTEFLTVKFAGKGQAPGQFDKDLTAALNGVQSNFLLQPDDTTTEENNNLYITGLPISFKEGDMVKIFSPYGTVLSARILKNPDSTSRGVGFIKYSSTAECQKAISVLTGIHLPNSYLPLTVKFATPAAKYHTPQALNAITTNTLNGPGAAARSSNVRYNPFALSRGILPHTMMNNFGTNIPSNVVNTFMTPQHQNIYRANSSNTEILTCVYIYGLQPHHKDLTLYELCAPFGPIVNVKLIRDMLQEDQPCKGYGFVNFAKSDDALRAVSSLNRVMFEQKTLQVSIKQCKSAQYINQNTQNSHAISNLVNIGQGKVI